MTGTRKTVDGVKVALGTRRMTVEAARQCVKDRNEWRALVHTKLIEIHPAILLSIIKMAPVLPCSGGYHPERGGMPFHDAVGINRKKGTTTENQGAGVKHMC